MILQWKLEINTNQQFEFGLGRSCLYKPLGINSLWYSLNWRKLYYKWGFVNRWIYTSL